MRAVTGLWRWRHNPLRRTTDLVEAWVALAAVVALCVAVPVAALTAASSARHSLQRAVHAQQQGRAETTARVLRPAPTPPSAAAADEQSAGQRFRRAVVATWTAPDGTPRTGTVTVSRGSGAPGDTFPLWTDREGRPVTAPMADSTARTHAAGVGVMAAALTGLAVETVRRLVMRRLHVRRYAHLDRAWASVGPDWGRTGTGS
ncbi:hypothetical protein [Streptomyces sp. CC208A]|uniref:Rv1733c family protein n=1 Tax=Streptomyces sp. CC208A TaxID=3044573 RepID=UPI0024A8C447|nr:hypothetical protein [Streptomyces sp. CC208A]